mmetsp:Transcript_80292/g.236156  ORF Transcript_80292/g.236156 Transcript_80292/m.236156 type:complete len:476 (+) Transcript_80292:71-1498(+)
MCNALPWASLPVLLVLVCAAADTDCSHAGEVRTCASLLAGGASSASSFTGRGAATADEEEFTSVLQLSVAVDANRSGAVAPDAQRAAAQEAAIVAETQAVLLATNVSMDSSSEHAPPRQADPRLRPPHDLRISWLAMAAWHQAGVPASTLALVVVLFLLVFTGAIIILYDKVNTPSENGNPARSRQHGGAAASNAPLGPLEPYQFPRLSTQRPSNMPGLFSRPGSMPAAQAQSPAARPPKEVRQQALAPLQIPVTRHVSPMSLTSEPAPSPRRMAQSSLSRPGIDQKLFLCERNIWAHFEAFFSIRAEQLPAEFGKVGDFDVLRGALLKPVFHGSVRLLDRGRRVFVLSATATDTLLASCRPSPGSCSIVDGYAVEPCSELQIRNKDNIVWGTTAPRAQDSYGVFQGEKQVFSLEGDQEAGRLIAYLEGEPIAHAARSASCEYLEVGVKPHIDPILMLIVFLSVVIFNPEEDGGT